MAKQAIFLHRYWCAFVVGTSLAAGLMGVQATGKLGPIWGAGIVLSFSAFGAGWAVIARPRISKI